MAQDTYTETEMNAYYRVVDAIYQARLSLCNAWGDTGESSPFNVKIKAIIDTLHDMEHQYTPNDLLKWYH